MAKSKRKHEADAKRRQRGPKNRLTDDVLAYREGKPVIDKTPKQRRAQRRSRLRREYL